LLLGRKDIFDLRANLIQNAAFVKWISLAEELGGSKAQKATEVNNVLYLEVGHPFEDVPQPAMADPKPPLDLTLSATGAGDDLGQELKQARRFFVAHASQGNLHRDRAFQQPEGETQGRVAPPLRRVPASKRILGHHHSPPKEMKKLRFAERKAHPRPVQLLT
jgi:hypothetical protein